jgi:hypothetical protein
MEGFFDNIPGMDTYGGDLPDSRRKQVVSLETARKVVQLGFTPIVSRDAR